MVVKQGKSTVKRAPVKHTNIKRVIIAITLALVGLVIYGYAYQYTHQAKLEADVRAKQTQIQKQLKDLQDTTNRNAEQQKQIEELTKQLQAKKAEQVRIASLAQKTVQAAPVSFTGTKADWMSAAGIAPSDWGYVDYIIAHESGWRPDARNSIGCLGLAQACPGQKILNVCPTLDPVCQLRWASAYANRYGGWAGSYSAWTRQHWW